MSETLTHQDVQRLLADPSATTRAEMATKVAAQFGADQLSPSERALAEDIVRLMARDAAVRVRSALSESLKTYPAIPRDVALQLARDVEEVSLPFIEVSSVLTDADLIELIKTGSDAKQSAVAKRPEVSEGVADVLVETGGETAVATLMGNEAARVTEAALTRVLNRFPKSDAVHAPLIERGSLPVTIAERLVTMVSEQLRERLVERHELPADVASDIVLQGREKATYGLVGVATDAQLETLVEQLYRNGRLSPSLLLRSLCMGDVAFFEVALAQLARIPTPNARMLIHDAGKLGMKALFDRTGMPQSIYPAIKVALDVASETEFDGGEHDLERHRRKMLERILTQFEEMASDDLDYLLSKLTDLTTKV
ncbi:DUF2336 domain-containing protein [Nitrospirillum sp. BR 11752]|uniref:DUF2336 domain-containing protein n=1 Tax=Nitrospirillum sp. BR 11752 TaxID=3104293 RepID=UPI002EA70703|nr:DUF2336 domain-containing protein [Nitrospirillum sp. BR 11752]